MILNFKRMAWLNIICFLFVILPQAQNLSSQREQMTTRANNGSTSLRVTSALTSGKCDFDLSERRAHCRNKGLESVPADLPPDTLRLDMSRNNIYTLRNDSFLRYTLLLFLDLSFNDITIIEHDAFKSLQKLVTLDLSANRNLASGDAFEWLHRLEILILDDCNFTSVPKEILRSSARLRSLGMAYNKLMSINITHCSQLEAPDLLFGYNEIGKLTPETFVIHCQADTVDVANPIEFIDPHAIAPLTAQNLMIGTFPMANEVLIELFKGVAMSSIEGLSVTGSNLKTIPPGFFAPLSDAPLFCLDLTFNDINPLNHSIFSNLTNVKKFVLSGNGIRSIEPEHFAGMTKLRILDLGYNDINIINPLNTTWAIDLHELYLVDNKLMEITSHDFYGLTNLTLIDLSNNAELTSLKITSFSGLDRLAVLDVHGTNLQVMSLSTPLLKSFNIRHRLPYSGDGSFVPGETFKTTTVLEFIDLTGSIFLTNSLWDSSRNLSLFQELSNLRILYLNQNPLGGVPRGVFSNLTSLEKLFLINCEISFIEKGLFSDLGSLRELHLEQNYLNYLASGNLHGLKQLLSLHADGNHISYISEDFFAEVPLLTTLMVSNNDLTTFNYSTFIQIKSTLSVIELVNNPIVCNCDIAWLIEWLSGPIDVVNSEQTYCSSASLAPLKQKPLLTFEPDEFCSPNITLISLLLLAGIGLVILLSIGYRNRWALRYKLFLLKLAVLGYDEIEDVREHGEFEFDLNVMCDDDDDEWLRTHLKPAMEERLPNFDRNIYGDRDLIAGMHYLDAVHYVVEKSYKTILLLSRNAVRNSWFLIKFRTALDHVNDYQLENMVVIFLEDIPDEELPFLVRLFLSDHGTYLTWTEDADEREYFWNKFTKLLKVNRRTNHVIPPE